MPKIFKNNGMTYIKMHRKQSFFFAFLLLFVMCMLIFNLSDIISSVITNSKSIFSQDKIEVPSYSVYVISITGVEDEERAEKLSYKVECLGGAGVKLFNGKHNVFIMLYPTLSQAKEIEENLLELENNVCIVTLDVPGVFKNYMGKEKNLVANIIKTFRKCYKNLFELIVNFDKGNKNVSYVKNGTKDIYNLVTKLLLDLKKSAVENDFKEALKFYLQKQKESLYKILDFTSEINKKLEEDEGIKIQFSSLVKKVCFESVFFNIDLVNKINNL